MSSYYEKFADGKVVCIDDEIPYNVPLGWIWCRLNELGTYRKGPFGSSLTKSMFVPKSEHAVKVYEQKNAIQKDYRLGEYYISEKKFMEMQSFVTKPSDIIVSCAGTIGETYLLPKEAPVGIINQALMRVELYNLDIADYWQLFFAYILLIENKMKGAGSAIKNIPPFEYLKAILVPIPPLQEQKRIIEKFNELIKLICQFTQKKDELDLLNDNLFPNIKKSILQEAIQGKLVPQDPSDEPASILLQRIRDEKQRLVKEGKLKKKDVIDSTIFRGDDNKYYENDGKNVVCIDDEIPFEIPSSWQWVRLEHICSYIQRGKSPKYSPIKQYPVVAQKCNQWTGFTIEKAQFIDPTTIESYTQERFLEDGDLMWNSTGLGTLGRMAIYWEKLNPYKVAVADSHVTVIRPLKSFVIPQYLYSYFSSYTVQSVIEDKADGSTKQKELATTTVKRYLVPFPPLAEQKRIVEKIKEVTSIMNR